MTSYVYGSLQGSLCLLPVEYAEAAADDYASLGRCSTVGEATAVAKSLKVVSAPDVLYEESEVLEDMADDPWEPWEYEDWPAAPAMVTLDSVGEELLEALIDAGVGTEEETFPQGPRFVIPESAEEVLVRIVQERGDHISRNDSLIFSLR
ncbi:MAG: hypothetical protein LH624_18480 [Cryobacterium sp.]|nr:hypothetical protein [Cryobacterium sp.]